MKTFNGILAVITLAVVLGGSNPAAATLSFSGPGGGGNGDYTVSDSPGITIPDNNPSGAAYSINFAASGLTVNPSAANCCCQQAMRRNTAARSKWAWSGG